MATLDADRAITASPVTPFSTTSSARIFIPIKMAQPEAWLLRQGRAGQMTAKRNKPGAGVAPLRQVDVLVSQRQSVANAISAFEPRVYQRSADRSRWTRFAAV